MTFKFIAYGLTCLICGACLGFIAAALCCAAKGEDDET